MTASNLSGGPWGRGLREGDAVEVCPFRSKTTRTSHAAFDGSAGVFFGPTEDGRKIWVDIKDEAEYRAGWRPFPVECLKPVEGS